MAAHVGLSPALTFSSSAVSSDQLMHSHYQQERPQLRLPPSPSLHPAMAPAAVAPTMELRPQPCHQAHPTPRPLQAAFSATAGDLPRHMQAAAQLATAASTPASRRKRELLQSALFGEDSGTDGGGGDDGGRQQQQPLPYSRPAAAAKPQGPRRLMQSAAAAAPSRWPWLAAQRTDASGRPPGHPEYDPTTLHIPPDALKAMSNFERQFWDIKVKRAA